MGEKFAMSSAYWNLFLFSGCLFFGAAAAAGRKNVLMLIADDGGFETSVYGNQVCKTPHINALASRSLVFSRAYTSVSSCSPSRSTIMSGLPQHQNGMFGLKNAHFESYDGVRSLPKLLAEQGNIYTGIVGKKHVGPDYVYPYDYAKTEENYDLMQVGRNITLMKLYVREFLSQVNDRNFFLYVGFNDPHRCMGLNPKYGHFCEKFGNGEPGMGVIPDWVPTKYRPEDVRLKFFLPDTDAARQEIASMYTTISRMDQGIGLMLAELEAAGHADDTLVIYTSDNGIPFPAAKTNLYEPGMGEPLFVSAPGGNTGKSDVMTTHLDYVPTVLEWFGMTYPKYKLNGVDVKLTGKSLMTLVGGGDGGCSKQGMKNTSSSADAVIFASHNLHEDDMYYPMRVVRNNQFKLIDNLNFKMPYPVATDIFKGATFLDMMNRTQNNQTLNWYKTLPDYYYRQRYELFDIIADPRESRNLASDPAYADVLSKLKGYLDTWRRETADIWLCSPQGVQIGLGPRAVCMSSNNGL